MKRIIIVFLGSISIFLSLNMFGQSRWLQGFFENQNVVGEYCVVSYDKGYLITGKYGQNYVHYVWLIKTDINGQIIWDKTFGDSDSYITFFDMIANNMGEIFLTGGTTYYDSYSDPIVMKLNSCGEKEWCRVFYTTNHFDYASSIVATGDGGCVTILRYSGTIPPYQTDRICLVKINNGGELIWKQCYNSLDTNIINEDSRSLLITPDNGFLITATCDYLDTFQTHLYWPKQYYIKTDSLGIFEWETVLHSNDGNTAGGDAWTSTINSENSYYYSSISHYYFNSDFSSPALVKMDLNGNLIDIYDIINGYQNGGLTYAKFINDSVMAAYCVYGNSDDDFVNLAVLIDTLGNIIDYKDLLLDIYGCVLQITNDQKLVYMYTSYLNGQYDVYLHKLNYALEEDTSYSMPFNYDSLCLYQIISDTIVQDDCELIVGIEEEDDKTGGRYDGRTGGLEVWPNPAGEQIHCRLSIVDFRFSKDYELLIYDIFGRKVEEIALPSGQNEILLDISGYPPGIYFVVVQDKTGMIGSAKFLVVH